MLHCENTVHHPDVSQTTASSWLHVLFSVFVPNCKLTMIRISAVSSLAFQRHHHRPSRQLPLTWLLIICTNSALWISSRDLKQVSGCSRVFFYFLSAMFASKISYFLLSLCPITWQNATADGQRHMCYWIYALNIFP